MKKLLAVALFTILLVQTVFASRLFDYRGVFPSDRGADARITNYILLKKGAAVRFELEEQGHGVSEKVKIAKVQLTSDTNISFAQDSGITRLDIPETGIYEITLVPSVTAFGEIRFVLNVIETSDEPVATETLALLQPASASAAIAGNRDLTGAVIVANSAVAQPIPDSVIAASPTATDSSLVLQPIMPVEFDFASSPITLKSPAPGFFLNPFTGFIFSGNELNLMPDSQRQKQFRIFNRLVDGSDSAVKGSFFSPEPDVLTFLPETILPGALYYVEILDATEQKLAAYQVKAMPELTIEFKPAATDLMAGISWGQQQGLLGNPAGQMLALSDCDLVLSSGENTLLRLTSEQLKQPFGSIDQVNWRARPYALDLELPLAAIVSECKIEILAAIDGNEQKTVAYSANWQKTAFSHDFSNVEASDDLIYDKPAEEFSIQPFSARTQLPDTTEFRIENSFLIIKDESERLLSWPQDVVWDENGSLWVLDSQIRRVANFNSSGQLRMSFGNRGNEPGSLGLPLALAQKNSTLFVSDSKRHAVHKFTTEGLFVVSIVSDPSIGVMIDLPGGICFRKDEMWVADRGAARILCFNQQAGFLGSFGSTAAAPIEAPVSVRANDDSLFILEKSGLVKKFSPMGQFDATFQSGSSDGSGLEVDSWGGIWVCDAGKYRVIRFSQTGAVLFELKPPPAAKPWLPTATAVRADGKVAVVDAANKMLHIFSPVD